MTQKELLYMEDAIGHEKNLQTICEYYSNIVEDEKLSTFLAKLQEKHKHLEEKLMKTMEDIAHE